MCGVLYDWIEMKWYEMKQNEGKEWMNERRMSLILQHQEKNNGEESATSHLHTPLQEQTV